MAANRVQTTLGRFFSKVETKEDAPSVVVKEEEQHEEEGLFSNGLELDECVKYSPSASSTVMSKKVTARKIPIPIPSSAAAESINCPIPPPLPLEQKLLRKNPPPPSLLVYQRRRKRPSLISCSALSSVKEEKIEFSPVASPGKKGKRELRNLGIDPQSTATEEGASCTRPKKSQANKQDKASGGRKRPSPSPGAAKGTKRKWVRLTIQNVNPVALVGLRCEVYWPLDEVWYFGRIDKYDRERRQHHVVYDDDTEEWLILTNEEIKFHLSQEELEILNPTDSSYDELIMLATQTDDCGEIEHGEVVWAKLPGYAMWPAIVMDELHATACDGLKGASTEKSVPVQFFGTYDYARISVKHVIPFLGGLLSSFHLKCKVPSFMEGLEEARRYLKERWLPAIIASYQDGPAVSCNVATGEVMGTCGVSEDSALLEGNKKADAHHHSYLFEAGDLRVISLGTIVKNSKHFCDEHDLWPLGYKAIRRFVSTSDPELISDYKMEVLRNPKLVDLPLFKVTFDDGKQICGLTPSCCWRKIYRLIKKASCKSPIVHDIRKGKRRWRSGSYMFGFCNKRVRKLIKSLMSNSSSKNASYALVSHNCKNASSGCQPIVVDLKDPDKCTVCYMDEEYQDNLFLHCDKCLMVAHARCYGELEPLHEKLWLCNLCRPGAPPTPPLCCLCPVLGGGAMKQTTDGRWAHLACVMWIPETFLVDVKRMEPIDGLNKISKDRWKLLCSLCNVPYGACIQCSHKTCRIAYHPLCARAAGLCVELEDEKDIFRLDSVLQDDDQCVRLVSFCKKHRKPSNNNIPSIKQLTNSKHTQPVNSTYRSSGCARAEPYDLSTRKGCREPDITSGISKHQFLMGGPYMIDGCQQSGSASHIVSSRNILMEKLQHQSPKNFISLFEKYQHMKATFRKRLAFGKSHIHGFGIFAKGAHKAGDMVIEYVGELVRPKIADRREHLFYNSLVGAGTYMFQIDDERVVDATKAGNIAHLINHSCEPNCYSRVITVCGDEHIIIFAKRDINPWEEITYDYRFLSTNERLTCHCGSSKCRGVVNKIEDVEKYL